MVTKASGLDKIAASFVDDDAPKKGRGRPKGSKTKKKVDERDPSVVAAQETCGMCGETGHGFNDCPNDKSLAEGTPEPTSRELSAPAGNGTALAARAFFREDGWLKLPEDLPFEGYKDLITRFGGLHRNMLWMAGDLQAQGEALYGQDYSQVVEMLAGHGYTESTLGIAKSLSEKFPPNERHKDLSWNHHVIVMSLPKKERKHWLDRAAAESLSTRELKAQMAAADGKPATPRKAAVPPPSEPADAESEDPDFREVDEEVGAAVPAEREQPVEAVNGVSLGMLKHADAADKEFYDKLARAIEDYEATSTCDYDALRGPTRALAAELITLIKALGDPKK